MVDIDMRNILSRSGGVGGGGWGGGGGWVAGLTENKAKPSLPAELGLSLEISDSVNKGEHANKEKGNNGRQTLQLLI